jgi:hypothetical protein
VHDVRERKSGPQYLTTVRTAVSGIYAFCEAATARVQARWYRAKTPGDDSWQPARHAENVSEGIELNAPGRNNIWPSCTASEKSGCRFCKSSRRSLLIARAGGMARATFTSESSAPPLLRACMMSANPGAGRRAWFEADLLGSALPYPDPVEMSVLSYQPGV